MSPHTGHAVAAVLGVGVLLGHGSSVEMLDPGLGPRRGLGVLVLGARVEFALKIVLNIFQLFNSEVVFEAGGTAVEERQHAWKGRDGRREGETMNE